MNGKGPLKVLPIVGGGLSGGAARGALYLSNALNELGIDSAIGCSDLQLDGKYEGAFSIATGFPSNIAHLAREKAESLPMHLFPKRDGRLFSIGLSGFDWAAHEAYRACDVVHLHWINRGTLSIEGLGRLRKPIVWTLRDMWPFTGGCHYSMDCSRYLQGCGCCPALGSTRDRDPSSWGLTRKVRHFPKDITYVGISDWIADCARASKVLSGRDIRAIPNSIDTDTFRPLSKQAARERLGLPLDRPILLHGTLSFGDAYKGQALLEDAKRRLGRSDIFTCTFGNVPGNIAVTGDRHFGLVTDDAELRAIYAAADVLAFPSTQEAFGKVLAEAMACGTPAVVFGATGPGEIITHKVTGYVAKPFDPGDFCAGIEWLLAEPERARKLGETAAEDARRRFNPIINAKRYVEIYRELMVRLKQ